MIRFIDLGDQITTDGTQEFAWYDTIVDKFITFNGNQVWETWVECEYDIGKQAEQDEASVEEETEMIKRLYRLFQWKESGGGE